MARVKFTGVLSFLLSSLFINVALGQDAKFYIQLDNDIFNLVNQTDYYYTNGVHVGLYHPALNKSFLNKILIGGASFNLQTTGFVVHQGIYTPQDIYTDQLQDYDRPYASTLLIGQERVVVSSSNMLRISSALNVGIIGKYAGGEFVQNFIHGLTPNSENANGWQHQIQNDFIIEYRATVEKGWLDTRYAQLFTSAISQVGTYKTQAGISGRLQFGLLDSRYRTVFGNDPSQTFSVSLFIGGNMRYMFYDATLEGGVFNTENTHAINRWRVNRSRQQIDLGLQLRYKKVLLECGRIWHNSEFNGGQHHAWGYIKMGVFL